MPHSELKSPRHVAVALVFSEKTHELLMITSRSHPDLWILPKGGVEEGETSGQAAVRESWEEAGTPPTLTADNELLTLSLESKRRGSVWHVHVIHTDSEEVALIADWPEQHQRKREWVSVQECLQRIQAWSADEGAREEVEAPHPDGIHFGPEVEAKKGKKALKGGAMEMALRAFADKYGWDKS